MKYIFNFLILLFPSYLFSQGSCVIYNYDENGNRVQRAIIQCEKLSHYDSIQYFEFFLTDGNNLLNDHDTTTKVYPNPANESIIVELSDLPQQPFDYRILNATGAMVLKGKITENVNRIKISEVNSGIYFLRIWFGKKYSTWKIIKN